MAKIQTSNMKFIPGDIEGLWIIEPTIHGDHRGYFFEGFRADVFMEKTGFTEPFVQDNESKSSRGVLRGLHLQKPPMAQGKLVRVVQGAVLDIAVDIRKSSPTYGQHQMVLLTEENKRQFFVPPGFAHGFLTLEDDTIFQYKCTNYYSPEHELGILWNDVDLSIQWEFNNPMISKRDADLDTFANFASPFA
jgi:dTDP-4-dehydrorhamnose 3,5-epimerase